MEGFLAFLLAPRGGEVKERMTIAQVSRQYGLSADTLRYYEKIGLLPPVPRTKEGIRDYDECSCRWIELIRDLRSAGVGIEALLEYTALLRQGDKTALERKALLVKQRELMAQDICHRQEMLCRLDQKIEEGE